MIRPRAAAARSRRLDVTVVAAPRWKADARGLARWVEEAAPAGVRGRLTVAVMADGPLKRLNRRFRGVDRATDVLSFPMDPLVHGGRRSGSPVGRRRRTTGGAGQPMVQRPNRLETSYLGDIAIAGGVAARQAAGQGHALSVELRILALHGLLHLLGYDHERDQGQMQRVEARLRRRMGLPAGLLARASR